MANGAQGSRGSWASRWGFVLAAAGSAVGLGNIWKFPYITGANGGGLFVLIYLVCIALVGVPIMMAEIMIGRAAQRQPVAAFHALEGKGSPWATIGWLGIIAGFVILSYYVVVAGWAMDYTLKSIVNFTEPIEESATVAAKQYRVQTPLDEMRAMLVKRRAERMAKEPIDDLRRSVPPSVLEGYETFRAAIGKSRSASARKVLFEDEVLAGQVAAYEQLLPEIERVRQEVEAEADAHYKALADEQIRDEAETVMRRAHIAESVQQRFVGLASDGWTSTFWALLFMLITVLIVAGGVSGGIERTCRVLMPTLFVLIAVMVIYGFFQPGFREAISFVFRPDASKLRPSGVLEALGHAFFTLSLGMGAMITYGSYQSGRGGLAGQSVLITFFDTLIALLACMMIFPIIFSYGQEPSAGPGLVFMSMPLAFAEIGSGGMLLAIIFFGLLVFAALTSAISLLEVVCSYFIDERGWSRRRAAGLLGAAVFLFGFPSAFAMAPSFAMTSWEPGYGKNFFDTMDYLASNWMLPLGGLLIAIYAGWVMPKRVRDAELEGLPGGAVLGWLLLVRFVTPVLVTIVLLQKVGILKVDELFG